MKQRNLPCCIPCCIPWSAFIQIQAQWYKSLLIWTLSLTTDWLTHSLTHCYCWESPILISQQNLFIEMYSDWHSISWAEGDLKWVVLNFPTGLLLQRLLKCAYQNSNLGKDFPSFKFQIFFQFAFNQFVHLMLGLGGHHKWTFEKLPWQLINPTTHLSLSVRYSTVDNLLLIVDKTNHII